MTSSLLGPAGAEAEQLKSAQESDVLTVRALARSLSLSLSRSSSLFLTVTRIYRQSSVAVCRQRSYHHRADKTG